MDQLPIEILLHHGLAQIFTDPIRKQIRDHPCQIRGQLFLRSAPGKRQQRNVPCLLDGGGQAPLVRCADSGETPRHNLAAFGHELRKQPNVFVVDGFNFLHAELANLLAAKIFAAALAATGAAGTRRTTLSAIGPRRTVSSGGTITARRAIRHRTSVCCDSHFFSHENDTP
jgi:hypothetical protein